MTYPISALLPLFFLFISCTDNQTDTLIYEPAGSADYYINNQSSTELNVVFVTTPELGSETDSIIVTENSSEKILNDGMFGVNPQPSDSFRKITFHISGKTEEPVFTFDPVTNNEWEIIGTDINETGFGLTEYEFTITDGMLEKLF